MYVFNDPILCLGGKCLEHLAAAKIWEMIASNISFKVRRTPQELLWNSYQEHAWDEEEFNTSSTYRRCWQKRT